MLEEWWAEKALSEAKEETDPKLKENVEVSFLITEQADGSYRVNFRSKGKYIINDIASDLGGGGHKFAAGTRISDSNAIEIEEKIVNLLKLKMDN